MRNNGTGGMMTSSLKYSIYCEKCGNQRQEWIETIMLLGIFISREKVAYGTK